jgi:hypothetical protein
LVSLDDFGGNGAEVVDVQDALDLAEEAVDEAEVGPTQVRHAAHFLGVTGLERTGTPPKCGLRSQRCEQVEATLTGERNLAALLRSLSPRLNDGRYVYTQVRTGVPAGADPVVVVREEEGMTLVLAQVQADELDLAYEFDAA